MRYMYYIWTLNILFYELCPEIGHKIHIPIHYGLHWEKFIGLWSQQVYERNWTRRITEMLYIKSYEQ